jgi:hypothetical protein
MPKHWLDQRLEELKPQGKSKAGLARALGLPSSRVSEFISGIRAIKGKELRPMAKYLEWSMDALAAKINADDHTRNPDTTPGNLPLTPSGNPGGAKGGPTMNPETAEIMEMVERMTPEERADMRLHAMRKILKKLDDKEPPEPGPTKVRRPS